jgi:hypothetical protein
MIVFIPEEIYYNTLQIYSKLAIFSIDKFVRFVMWKSMV